MSGQWSGRLFWLAGTVNLRLCVGLVLPLWQKLESRRGAISMRRVTGKPGLTEEGGA